jgi:DNA-binding transcriptional LysR family regulator
MVKRNDDLMTILTYASMGNGIGVMPQIMTRMNIPNVVYREIATNSVPKSAIAFVYRRNDRAAADLRIRYSLTPVIVRQMRDA